MGKAGSGKSSAADMLASTLGYKQLSLAEPLRHIAKYLWPSRDLDRDTLLELGKALRDLDRGTLPDFLLRALRLMRNPTSPFGTASASPVVVDDLRMENEWWALKGAGFVIVRLERDRETRIARLKAGGKWQHESQLEDETETAVDHLDADYTVDTNADPDVINDAIIDIVIKERARR